MMTAVKNDQSGQALIELIIFLPLMFALYSMVTGFANAINGSINQQKITRSYFYYRVQNNSNVPKPDLGNTYRTWRTFGMYFVGWKNFFEGEDNPVMPCYRISLPLTPNGNDKCGDKYTEQTTQHIRVGTVYGICGATYSKLPSGGNDDVFLLPDADGADFKTVTDISSCIIQ